MAQETIADSAATLWVNPHGMEFVRVEPGVFDMGSEVAGWSELAHEVEISRPFYIGRYEVTQAQWDKLMSINPSETRAAEHPVENVTWLEVDTFIRHLNECSPGETYRLPTEAEWEYAAKAGERYVFTGTDNVEELCRFGNIADVSARVDSFRATVNCYDGYYKTAPVGQFAPNSWGIYDMTGNVWEWANDHYDAAYYARSPRKDPKGPISGNQRVLRGGGWGMRPPLLRLSYRTGVDAGYRSHAVGFRLVREEPDKGDRP